MFQIDLKNIIQILVDRELDRKSSPILHDDCSVTKKGILIDLDLRADHYTNETGRDKSISKSLWLLFHGNTSVYWVLRNREPGHGLLHLDEISVNNWTNTSNHDSCWRSDGFCFLDDIFFDFCDKISPKLKPKDVNITANLGIGLSWPVKQVDIRYKHKPSNEYGNQIISVCYRQKLK